MKLKKQYLSFISCLILGALITIICLNVFPTSAISHSKTEVLSFTTNNTSNLNYVFEEREIEDDFFQYPLLSHSSNIIHLHKNNSEINSQKFIYRTQIAKVLAKIPLFLSNKALRI